MILLIIFAVLQLLPIFHYLPLPFLPSSLRPSRYPQITRYFSWSEFANEIHQTLGHAGVHSNIDVLLPDVVPHLSNRSRQLWHRELVLVRADQRADEDELHRGHFRRLLEHLVQLRILNKIREYTERVLNFGSKSGVHGVIGAEPLFELGVAADGLE